MPRRPTVRQLEAQHGTCPVRQKLLRARVVRVIGQARVADADDVGVRREVFGDALRVAHMLAHAQRQGLDTLQNLECVHR